MTHVPSAGTLTTFQIGSLALLMALVACAPPPPPPRAPVAVQAPPPPAPVACTPLAPRLEQSSLMEHVPADATVAVVLRRNALGWYERTITGDKQLEAQLRDHYVKSLGVDFTGVKGLVYVGFSEAGLFHPAVFVHVPSLATLTGEARGIHREIPLIATSPTSNWLGASLREGVWFGEEGTLRRVLDHELEHRSGLFFDVDGPDVDMLGYMRFDAETDGTMAALSSAFGVEYALLKLDAARKVTLILKGQDARIEKARAALDTALQSVLDELGQLVASQAPGDTFGTALTIMAYHEVRKFGEAARPRVNGLSLYSEYELGPWLDSLPLGAGAAALTVPAVLAQVTRGKTGQARTELTRVASALVTYHEATRNIPSKKKNAPPPVASMRIGRTPRVVPCGSDVRWDEDEMAAWQELGYAPNGPMRYALEVGPPRAFGRKEPPEVVLMVRAEGDLDCDGVVSRFDMLMQLDEAGNLVRAGDLDTQNEAE